MISSTTVRSLEGVKRVTHEGRLLAIIVRGTFKDSGVTFISSNELPQQLGVLRHAAGTVIQAHTHQPIERIISQTCETLFIRKGELLAEIYDDDRRLIDSTVLIAGDVILLCGGGHGFKALKDVDVVEVKQGPYVGEREKVRF